MFHGNMLPFNTQVKNVIQQLEVLELRRKNLVFHFSDSQIVDYKSDLFKLFIVKYFTYFCITSTSTVILN